MTTELKQAAQDAAEAIDWLLKNIRLDAPRLSGKAMGNAEKCASALRAALSNQPATPEPVDFPAGAIVNGRTLMERIEAYPFESQGVDLRMCSDWHELRRCFEYLADYVSPRPAPSVPADVVRDAERYRWLRDNGVLGFSGAPSWRVSVSFDAMDAYAQTLDSNIDAAMLAAK